MPIDYSHQHVSTSIMQVDSPHEPINPAGGGVNLDPGDGTPVPVSTLVAPGAVIAGDRATLLTMELLGPYRIDYTMTTPVSFAEIPDGSVIVRVFAVGIDSWSDINRQLLIGLSDPDRSDAIQTLISYDSSNSTNSASWHVWTEDLPVTVNFDPGGYAQAGVVRGPGVMLVGDIYNGGGLTAGSADIYAIIATLAS